MLVWCQTEELLDQLVSHAELCLREVKPIETLEHLTALSRLP